MASNMLRPLLYLFTVISLTGAVPLNIAQDTEVDISSCPLTFYEKEYTTLYVSLSAGFYICFNGFYNSSVPDDCLDAPFPDNGVDMLIQETSANENTYKTALPTITNSMNCTITFDAFHEGIQMYVILAKFEDQTAMLFDYSIPPPLDPDLTGTLYKDVDVYVDGTLTTSAVVSDLDFQDYVDISGCRALGKGFSATGLHYISSTCTEVTCTLNRSLSISARCNDDERCDGSGTCLVSQTCTVTGPAVIDVHEDVDFIEDRCSYALVSDWQPDYLFLANFRERLRTDVSFVDSVTLRVDGSDIVLGHGGRVLVDNTPLTLNSSVQEVYGVELSKDQTGLHAKVSSGGLSASVFFDGDTAQIHIEVPVGSSLDGLCGNSSSSISAKLSGDSSSSCDTPYPEAADSTIDCSAITESCNILQGEPFSSCNTEVDPAPYISACSDTLCKYPAVDGLRCQFLWAYARACSLKNATLGDWWSDAECSSPEAFCQDTACSTHEFCAMKSSGGKTCLCRAIFASSYKDSNSLGDPTVCTQNTASLSLVGCLLEEKNIDYSMLHLNNDTCKGVMDEDTHMVTFSFDTSNTCGAVITANDSQVTYKNAIVSQNTSEVITRHDQFYIDFSCIHIQPEIKTVAFRIKDSSVVQHITSEEFNYTVTMTAYTDAALTQVVSSGTEVLLNQKIWVELDTEGLDADLIAVVLDSCWATDQELSSSTPRHNLIQNSCASSADQTVRVEGNGEGASSYFSFNVFQFTGNSGEVYLHCKLKLCVKEGNTCVPNCSAGVSRRRRSVRYKRGASASVSMAWIY